MMVIIINDEDVIFTMYSSKHCIHRWPRTNFPELPAYHKTASIAGAAAAAKSVDFASIVPNHKSFDCIKHTFYCSSMHIHLSSSESCHHQDDELIFSFGIQLKCRRQVRFRFYDLFIRNVVFKCSTSSNF